MVSDEVLIRLLEIARDIDNGVETAEEMTGLLAPMTEAECMAMVDYSQEHGRCPPLTGLAAVTDRLRDNASRIGNIVLDLMGVPPESDDFCRDWAHDQLFKAEQTGCFHASLGRIRRAVAEFRK